MWAAIVAFFMGLVKVFHSTPPAATVEGEKLGAAKTVADAEQREIADVQKADVAAAAVPVDDSSLRAPDPDSRD